MSTQNLAIDEASVIATLSHFAETHNAQFQHNTIKVINGFTIKSLISIYDVIYSLHDLMDVTSWIEQLMMLLNNSIRYELNQTINEIEPTKVDNDIYNVQQLLMMLSETGSQIKEIEKNTKQYSKQ